MPLILSSMGRQRPRRRATSTRRPAETLEEALGLTVVVEYESGGDGGAFAGLMIDYGVGVSTRRVYKIKAVDTDFFDE